MDIAFITQVNLLCDQCPASWESGDRTPSHNASVGGAKGSYHVKHCAIDLIYDNTALLLQAAKVAITMGFLGIEVDFTNMHLHLDARVYPWQVARYQHNQALIVDAPLKEYLTALKTSAIT